MIGKEDSALKVRYVTRTYRSKGFRKLCKKNRSAFTFQEEWEDRSKTETMLIDIS